MVELCWQAARYRKKTVAKSPKLCSADEPILLDFSSSYMVESGFSHVQYIYIYIYIYI